MTQEERRGLLESMAEYGQIDPIVTHEGMILDGRARYECCIDLGIAPVFKEWTGEGGTPMAFVVGRNLERHAMTPDERAAVMAKVASKQAEMAEGSPCDERRIDLDDDRRPCDDRRMTTTESRPPGPTMSDVLRQAIVDSGASYRSLFLATGVQRATIQRFVENRTSIRLDLADRLAEHLGLELKRSRRWGRSSKRS